MSDRSLQERCKRQLRQLALTALAKVMQAQVEDPSLVVEPLPDGFEVSTTVRSAGDEGTWTLTLTVRAAENDKP